uniref:rRNA methyltransferase 2, mitochondrial n=1 Tax=Timema genevievae TaxID=629358 RepID=A0A7R9KA05_TIMGE|nr:unnamed protein product [Timema genevievae]
MHVLRPHLRLSLQLKTSDHVLHAAGFTMSAKAEKQAPTNLKGRSKSSQEWLSRQLADPYVEKAKMSNYRCRSAFKLIEIDDKFRLLSPGQCVVDCGAAPGSWSQVLVQRTNALTKDAGRPVGTVIAIDRLPIYPIEGVTIIGNTDFTTAAARERLLSVMEGRQADAVVSDMAPNATGVRAMDHENIVHLAYSAVRFAAQTSRVGAFLLVKLWDGAITIALERDLMRFYDKVKAVKPMASRSDSAEMFFLARGFKGLQS